MSRFPHPPDTSPADRIRFCCGNCRSPLEVPAALAGVEGPCPLCGESTAAPPLENTVARGEAARLLAKPPLCREIPPPLGLVEENRLPPETVRPIPLRTEVPPAPEAMPVRPIPPAPPEPQPEFPRFTEHAPANEIADRPEEFVRGDTDAAPAPADRGIFAGPSDVKASLLHRGAAASGPRRHSWKRWMDIGIVSVFTGLLLATVAALRFTVPMESLPLPGLPENLNELVERETQSQRLREQEAGALACAAVNRYLGAGSEQAAASHLLPPPEGMTEPAYPPFPQLQTSDWEPGPGRRIPFTDRYLITVRPKEAPGPVFIVEETDSGPRLHAGPITQQSAGLFEKFTATPGEGEAVLYVEVCPTPLEEERGYRARRPDLAPWRFVDVRCAFPAAERKEWIFCLEPDSEAAQTFARRAAHDPGWRRALVQVRWHQHREAGPWAELVKFIPGVWSGDPPAPPPATTAFTSP